MSDDNKIVSLVAERKKRQDEENAEVFYTELPEPSREEVNAFLRVLGYLRQISPDQTGKVSFDPFAARVELHANKLDYEDDVPQVNVGLTIEGVLPFVWTHLTDEEMSDDEHVSLGECTNVAHDIILQLDSSDEEPTQ